MLSSGGGGGAFTNNMTQQQTLTKVCYLLENAINFKWLLFIYFLPIRFKLFCTRFETNGLYILNVISSVHFWGHYVLGKYLIKDFINAFGFH